MKVKIVRSFAAKVQLKQYEPIDSFCAVEMEYELASPIDPGRDSEEMQKISTHLDNFCRAEVKKTIEQVKANQDKINNKKNRKIEVKQDAKNTAELEAGDVEIIPD